MTTESNHSKMLIKCSVCNKCYVYVESYYELHILGWKKRNHKYICPHCAKEDK